MEYCKKVLYSFLKKYTVNNFRLRYKSLSKYHECNKTHREREREILLCKKSVKEKN